VKKIELTKCVKNKMLIGGGNILTNELASGLLAKDIAIHGPKADRRPLRFGGASGRNDS